MLGAPDSSWAGGARGADGHAARGGHAARAQRHLLLPVLHAVQSRVGWISPARSATSAGGSTIPPAEAYGVASFYALFALEPRPPVVTHVCTDIACMCRGGDELVAELERTVGPAGEHPGNGTSIWLESPCLGLCERAPAALVTAAGEAGERARDRPGIGRRRRRGARGRRRPAPPPAARAAGGRPGAPAPAPGRARRPGEPRQLPRRTAATPRCARRSSIGPAGVIREVTDSKLLGRGGAAFPTGRKWDAVARNPVRPHYLVCNADESEPGHVQGPDRDRARPVRARRGDDDRRASRPAASRATSTCAASTRWPGSGSSARDRRRPAPRGLLGDDVMGAGLPLRHRAAQGRRRLHLRRGDRALQLDRGLPRRAALTSRRSRSTSGLFGKPTVVNNVETLVNVLDIVLEGGAAFAGIGTEQSTGTRLFCLSRLRRAARPLRGAVRRHAAATLLEMAGGVAGGRDAAGGAARRRGRRRSSAPTSSTSSSRSRPPARPGATLGSGVSWCSTTPSTSSPILLRIAAFFRDESCGQCVPCRVGTVRQQEALLRLATGRPRGTVGRRARAARRDRARRCATPRSAASARPRPTRSSRPSARCASFEPEAVGMSAVPVTIRRTVELEIDGEAVRVARGRDDPRRLPRAGARHPHALLRRDADAGERLPRVRGRGRGLARARAVLRAQGRGRHGRAHRHPSASATAARWCSSSSGSSVDLSTTPDVDALDGEYGAAARALRPAGAAAPAGERDRAQAGHHHAGDGQTAATVAQPVKVDNELYVRDYCEVHPLLQVRRGLRHRLAEHVRDRRRRPRVRRAHRHRVRRAAARLGVRLLRQLHRRLPDGRAHVQERVRHARRRARGTRPRRRVTETICSYCGVGCSLELHVQDNDDRQGHLAARPRRDARQPLRQGPLRLPVRAEPSARGERWRMTRARTTTGSSGRQNGRRARAAFES